MISCEEATDKRKYFSVVLILLKSFFYLRAVQGHSDPVDPSLQDNILSPTTSLSALSCRMLLNMHSIIESGLIAGDKNASRDRQTVFSTAVNPLATHCHEQKEIDLTSPDMLLPSNKLRVHQDAVYWIDVRLAQKKGLKFFQTRSYAIILYDTLPPICFKTLVSIKTQEVKYTKIKKSPRAVATVTPEFWCSNKQQQRQTNPIKPEWPHSKYGVTRNFSEV